MSNKPEIKIAIKPTEGGGSRVDLFAFWRRDNGKLSGALDRRVKGIRVYLEDGTQQTLRRIDGNKHSHWIDCYEDAPPPPRDARPPSGGRDDFPPDDFGDDGDPIPF